MIQARANQAVAFGFAVICSGMAYGQTPLDESVAVEIERPLSESEVRGAVEHMNPRRAPNTDDAYAETDDGLLGGAMTDDGPVEEFGPADRAYGTFGIPYTTTRVQEGNGGSSATPNASRLSTTYPYRAVGRLTFRTAAGNSYCSASVIRRGIIVTAAHCIQRFGSGTNRYSNWEFRPGYYGATGATASQMAPYGTWTPLYFLRPTSWQNGTDVGQGAARDNDIALLALRKVGGEFIGDVVGYFSYGWNNYSFVSSPKTGNLSTAAVSTLGYPGLMDQGQIMQRADGPTYPTTVGGAKQLWQGNNFTGGSSGGPWVVNFSGRNAALSGGAVPGTRSIMAIVGVTSWGSADPNRPKDNYSSQFAQNTRYPLGQYGGYGAGNIGSLLNTLCNATAPEGGTLKSQGYCN